MVRAMWSCLFFVSDSGTCLLFYFVFNLDVVVGGACWQLAGSFAKKKFTRHGRPPPLTPHDKMPAMPALPTTGHQYGLVL